MWAARPVYAPYTRGRFFGNIASYGVRGGFFSEKVSMAYGGRETDDDEEAFTTALQQFEESRGRLDTLQHTTMLSAQQNLHDTMALRGAPTARAPTGFRQITVAGDGNCGFTGVHAAATHDAGLLQAIEDLPVYEDLPRGHPSHMRKAVVDYANARLVGPGMNPALKEALRLARDRAVYGLAYPQYLTSRDVSRPPRRAWPAPV
jgi:hypothetical protein